MTPEKQEWVGVGMYTLPEAARLIGTNTLRVRRWLEGYRFPTKSGTGESPPLFSPQLPALGEHQAIGFSDLVELLFIKAFRDHGVSLPAIRRAAKDAAKRWHTDHPFCLKRFATDGRTIFSFIEDEVGDRSLLDLVRSQLAFHEVLQPFLIQLDYGKIGHSIDRWWPLGKNKPVFLDPRIAFGRPVVLDKSMPTEALYRAVLANQSEREVARWFEVSVSAVRAAVFFEEGLAA
ncbi:MAG: DUF433 domain-containing protein [Planctomycetes bacterium]|nr:DUF433 domain-containing protein [Planctomycetota bacterium]